MQTNLRAARSEPGSSRGEGVHVWGRCSAVRRLPPTEPAPPDWLLWMWRAPNLEAKNGTVTYVQSPIFSVLDGHVQPKAAAELSRKKLQSPHHSTLCSTALSHWMKLK